MFEKATRLKLRFVHKGNISTEDLWDLSLDELDSIYKVLSKTKKLSEAEDSLKKTNNKEENLLTLKIELVKHIFKIKEDEALKREENASRMLKKRKLLEIIASKQDQHLQSQSIEELTKQINELDD